MEKIPQRVAPFMKQCIAVLAVSIHGSQYGLVLGFTAYLLPDLKRPDSKMPIDDSTGSWIVASPSLSMVLTNLMMPWFLYRFGRRTVLGAGVFGAVVTWLAMAMVSDVYSIIVIRLCQGSMICVSSVLSSLLISEYVSPNLRGPFLSVLTLFIIAGTTTVHFMGSFMTWQQTALSLAIISFINLVIVIYIPESPSYLITKERYDEAREAFVWLRGKNQDEELRRMVEFNVSFTSETRVSKYEIKSFVSLIRNLKVLIVKPEFYKPIIIVLHLYSIMQFSCIFILCSYTVDIAQRIVGKDDVSMVIVGSNITRLVTSVLFIFFNKILRRRTVLGFSVGMTAVSLLVISLYTYGVTSGWFPNYPAVGTLLFHLHMFSIAAGSMPMPIILAGELFPLQFRGFSTVIIVMYQSTVTFISLKTAPLLFDKIGLHWTYCIYAGFLMYFLVFSMIFLPETKDRTLQDIEDEFRGRKAIQTEVLEPLDRNLYESAKEVGDK